MAALDVGWSRCVDRRQAYGRVSLAPESCFSGLSAIELPADLPSKRSVVERSFGLRNPLAPFAQQNLPCLVVRLHIDFVVLRRVEKRLANAAQSPLTQ